MVGPDPIWRPPPPQPALGDGEVHVWRATLDRPAAAVDDMRRTLSDGERQRAARFRFDRDRDRYVVGRALLRVLCGLYLDEEPEKVRLSYGRRGKPGLGEEHGKSRLELNLAHSGPLALYAFTRGRLVGVDVEQVRPMPDADEVAGRFFSPREHAVYSELPSRDRLLGFYLCWTRKEAFIKALGEGLSVPLDSFDVSLVPGEPARLIRVAPDPDKAARWTLISLEPMPGYVGAVAIQGVVQQVIRWDCP